MSTVVAVHGVTMRFRGHTAVDNISAAIEENAITGLLGRNGAGKTTLMQLMAGHLVPTTGSIEVFGANPYENESVSQRMSLVNAGPGLLRDGTWRGLQALGSLGLYVLTIGTILGVGGVSVLITWQQGWTRVGEWLGDQSPVGLVAGWPLLFGVLVAAAGYLGIRRVVP